MGTLIIGWAKETLRIKFQTGCLSIGHTIYLGVGDDTFVSRGRTHGM